MNASIAVVWLDATVARVFRFSEERMQRQQFSMAAGSYDALVAALADERRILILGAEDHGAKFWNHLRERHPKIAGSVVGSEETADPSDHQIAQFAIQYARRRALA